MSEITNSILIFKMAFSYLFQNNKRKITESFVWDLIKIDLKSNQRVNKFINK